MGYCKYKKEILQVSYDNGVTYANVVPTSAKTGELIEKDAPDCSYIPPTPSGCSCDDLTTEDAYSKQYLTFIPTVTSTTFTFNKKNSNSTDILYSVDSGSTWASLSSGTSTPYVAVGQKIMWKGEFTPNTAPLYYSGVGVFSSSNKFNVEGNIMSLLYEDAFSDKTSIYGTGSAFYGLLSGCTNIVSAENLILPSDVGVSCYAGMFKGCSSLTTAPALPATTLAASCYAGMFQGCSSLTTAPTLPATTLAEGCYYNMFSDCTSLTTAPSLPATTLDVGCYENMFRGCTNLRNIPSILPATTLAVGCYIRMFEDCSSLTTAPTLPATTLADSCYYSMFEGCSGLTTAPTLPATTLANSCYWNMFSDCTSLTTAPSTLPATTLAGYCYKNMFRGCTNLRNIPSILPATTLADSCYAGMFWGCTSLTTSPTLPATTLADSCYNTMFDFCSSLSYVKCLATDVSEYLCTNYWMNGTPSSGTFVKASNMESWQRGSHGIPWGWTIQNA